jgi:hypothetical protein
VAFVGSLIPEVLTFWWIREPSGGELGPDIIKYTFEFRWSVRTDGAGLLWELARFMF